MLLKAADFSQATGNKAAFNLNDIIAEARSIIDSAKLQAEELITQAREDIHRDRLQAREEGKREGIEQGLFQGQEQGRQQAFAEAQTKFAEKSTDALQALTQTCEAFDQSKQQILWQAEQDTIALAITIAKKVIKQCSLLHREIAVENVKAALELVAAPTDVVVHLSRKDFEYMQEMAGKNESLLGKYHRIKFEPDDNIEPGGCRVYTSQGQVDARLDTQIERIARELLVGAESKTPEVKD